MAGKPVAASLRVRAPPGLRLAVPRQVYGCSASSGPGRAAMCARGRRPAREIATREPDGSEWSISKPGQAPPPPTGTAARPYKRRVCLQPGGAVQPGLAGRVLAFCLPDPGVAHGHRSQASQAPCLPPTRRGGARYGLGRGDQGIRMGPTRKGRPHCCRGIEPAGDVAATCHPGSWRRRSCRPWRPGRPARSRATRVDLRWCGHSRKRGRQAASARRRAGRRASCRPS